MTRVLRLRNADFLWAEAKDFRNNTVNWNFGQKKQGESFWIYQWAYIFLYADNTKGKLEKQRKWTIQVNSTPHTKFNWIYLLFNHEYTIYVAIEPWKKKQQQNNATWIMISSNMSLTPCAHDTLFMGNGEKNHSSYHGRIRGYLAAWDMARCVRILFRTIWTQKPSMIIPVAWMCQSRI